MNSNNGHRAENGPLNAGTYPIDAYRAHRCRFHYRSIGNDTARLGNIGSSLGDVATRERANYKAIPIDNDSDYSSDLMAKHLISGRPNLTPLYNDLYELATTVRSKLEKEANGAEHNMRLLVGHANLLDDLMEVLYARKEPPKIDDRWTSILDDLGDMSDDEIGDEYSDDENLHIEYDGEPVADTLSLATGLENGDGMSCPIAKELESHPLGPTAMRHDQHGAPTVHEVSEMISIMVEQVEDAIVQDAKVTTTLDAIEHEVLTADLLHEYGAGEDLALTRVASHMSMTAAVA